MTTVFSIVVDEKVRLGLLLDYKKTFRSIVILLLYVVSSGMDIRPKETIKVSPVLTVSVPLNITIVRVRDEGRLVRERTRKVIEGVVVIFGSLV